VVISGTLKPVRRLENPVPVEIITATFLKLNPTANIFDVTRKWLASTKQLQCL
jgi:outer membrane receptor for ferrienterochelin and colicins